MNSISRRRALGILAAGAGVLVASPGLAGARLSVVATTGMIADAARRVGGAHVAVKGLMGPGIDPHSYRQTRSDIASALRADVTLWHGLYLEAQMEEFFRKLARRNAVTAVGEAVAPEKLRAHDDYDNKFDPHIWMDPLLWVDAVAAVRDALSEAAPQHADDFKAAAAAYIVEIEALAGYGEAVLATIPGERRLLVTAHDAFGYFGAAHDFDVVGIQGISTESEAGLNRIAELVDLLVTRDIGAVFVESSVSDRNIRALIEGAAARGHAVRIGGELFSDAMGPEDSYEGTYLGMIDHNVTTIARALGADAPRGGMVGRLATVKENA